MNIKFETAAESRKMTNFDKALKKSIQGSINMIKKARKYGQYSIVANFTKTKNKTWQHLEQLCEGEKRFFTELGYQFYITSRIEYETEWEYANIQVMISWNNNA